MKQTLLHTFFSLILITFHCLGFSQIDTKIVEKEPVIIKQNIYYTTSYSPNKAKNSVSIGYNFSPISNKKTNHSTYNKVTLNDLVSPKAISISYARNRKGILISGGLGISTRNVRLNQTSFSREEPDSLQIKTIDTISCFVLITPEDGLQHICETEENSKWIDTTKTVERSSSESTYRSTHLRIPLSIGYVHFKKRISLSASLNVVTNILIGNYNQIQFYNEDFEFDDISTNWFQSAFWEINPQIDLGYNFDIGIGIYASYRLQYLLTSPDNFTLPENHLRSFTGLSVKYFF